MTPAETRTAFEKFGTPMPTEGGITYLHLSVRGDVRVVEFSANTGRLLEFTDGGAYTPEPGHYLPLARLLAAVPVAEALAEWTAVSDDDPWADALTTYRSTR